MTVQILPFFRRGAASRDWSNAELAQLYRVESALVQLNIALQTDRGVSDEGDPWFVFCRGDGEVLVHFARFDGLYHVHAPTVLLSLSAASFEELTRRFVDRCPVSVPLKRDPKVILHPSAIFTILVAAAFFASEHDAKAAAADAHDGDAGQGDARDADAAASDAVIHRAAGKHGAARSDKQADAAHSHLSVYFNAVAAAAAIVLDLLPHDLLSSAPQFEEAHSHLVSELIDAAGLAAPAAATAADSAAASLEHRADAARHSPDWTPTESSDAALALAGLAPAHGGDGAAAPAEPDHGHDLGQMIASQGGLWDGAEFHPGAELALSHLALAFAAAPRGSDAPHPAPPPATSAPAAADSAPVADSTASSPSTSHPADAPASSSDGAAAVWTQVAALLANWSPGGAAADAGSAGSMAHAASASMLPLTAANVTHYSEAMEAITLTIKNFILSFDSSHVVVEGGSIFVYDGLTAAQDSSALVTKTWEFDTGATISIVGHADHPIHYVLVA